MFLFDFFELLSSARKGCQETRKSVFSQLGHSSTIVARARAVRMSPGGVPEAQGARHSGRTEGLRRGLSARRNPRRGKRVKRWAWEEVAPRRIGRKIALLVSCMLEHGPRHHSGGAGGATTTTVVVVVAGGGVIERRQPDTDGTTGARGRGGRELQEEERVCL